MGSLTYGESHKPIEFDDRDLAHLQIAMGAKLRRRESFFFSWVERPSAGSGRGSVWIDAGISLYFRYFGSKPPAINREWLDLLTLSANSPQGLQLLPEPNCAGSNGNVARVRADHQGRRLEPVH